MLVIRKGSSQKERRRTKRKDKEREKESKKKLAKLLKTVNAAFSQVENWISIGDEELLSKKNSTQKDLQRAQSKIEMGIKCWAELLIEETVLKKKLRELEKDNWALLFF